MIGKLCVAALLVALATVNASPCDNGNCLPSGRQGEENHPNPTGGNEDYDIPNHPRTMTEAEQLCKPEQVYDNKRGTCVSLSTKEFEDSELAKKINHSRHRRDSIIGSISDELSNLKTLVKCGPGNMLFGDTCVDKNVVYGLGAAAAVFLILIVLCCIRCKRQNGIIYRQM